MKQNPPGRSHHARFRCTGQPHSPRGGHPPGAEAADRRKIHHGPQANPKPRHGNRSPTVCPVRIRPPTSDPIDGSERAGARRWTFVRPAVSAGAGQRPVPTKTATPPDANRVPRLTTCSIEQRRRAPRLGNRTWLRHQAAPPRHDSRRGSRPSLARGAKAVTAEQSFAATAAEHHLQQARRGSTNTLSHPAWLRGHAKTAGTPRPRPKER